MPNEKIDRRHQNSGRPKSGKEPRSVLVPFKITATEKAKIVALGYDWLREQLQKART